MLRKQIIDLSVTVFGLVSARAFALLSSILIARVSGASTFGEYSFFITVFVILSEVPNAIDTTFIRFSNSLEKPDLIETYQLIAIITKLAYAFLITTIGWLGASFIANDILNKPETVSMIQWCVLAASFMSVHTLLIGRFQQKKQFHYVALARPVLSMFVFFVLVYFAWSGTILNIENISKIYIYVAAPLAFLTLLVLIPKTKNKFNESLGLIKPFLNVALILISSSMVGLVANRLDIFVMTSTMTFSEVGLYGVAIRISILVALITAAMTTIYVPKASAATQSYEAYTKYLHMIFNYSLMQTILAAIIIWQIELIVALLFGEEYEGVEAVAIILIVQVLFEAYARGFQALAQCGPRPSMVFYSAIIRLILSALLLVYLIPIYGVKGGAIAVATTSGIVGLFIVIMALKDCKPDKMLAP